MSFSISRLSIHGFIVRKRWTGVDRFTVLVSLTLYSDLMFYILQKVLLNVILFSVTLSHSSVLIILDFDSVLGLVSSLIDINPNLIFLSTYQERR